MEEGLLTQRHSGSINTGASSWKRTRDLYGPTHTALDPPEKPHAPPPRLQSLDAVRGLNVWLMIFVDNVVRAGGFEEWVYHSPWDTIHLADFVMPLFLFMVGVSLAFSMNKYSGPGITRKIFSRTAKLLILGLILQGGSIFRQLDGSPGPGLNMHNLRICGILQRIAWAYCVVALMKLLLPVWTVNGFRRPYTGSFADAPAGRGRLFCHYGAHWFVALAFFGFYLAVMLLAHVPSWSFEIGNRTFTQACDMRGDLTPACSATRLFDRGLLGWNHLDGGGEYTRSVWCSACSPYGDFTQCPHRHLDGTDATPAWCLGRLDPEGALSSVPTILTTWLGLHFGLVLVHNPGDHASRLKHLTAMSILCVAVGWLITPLWKMNKQLWSPSYLFFTAGCCGLLLVLLYLVYDLPVERPAGWLRALRLGFEPARWIGMNTIFIYLMAPAGAAFQQAQNWVYFNDDPKQNFYFLTYTSIFCKDSHFDPHRLAPPGAHVPPGAQVGAFSKVCGAGSLLPFENVLEKWAQLAWTLARIVLWTAVAGGLHMRRWYWAL